MDEDISNIISSVCFLFRCSQLYFLVQLHLLKFFYYKKNTQEVHPETIKHTVKKGGKTKKQKYGIREERNQRKEREEKFGRERVG